jgi:hypothetical protein
MLYALVHDNQLILGPIKYNYMLINYELEQLEINSRLTSNSYNQVPIQFDEKTFLVYATQVYPDYDGRYKKITSPSWSIQKENELPSKVLFEYFTEDRTLEEVKNELKSIVPNERWNKENTTVKILVQNTEVEVSTSRDNRLSLMAKLLSLPGPYNFKFGENLWMEITSNDLQSIILAIDAKVQEAFDWELAKIQEIDSCETVEDVWNVEIYPPLPSPEPNIE